MCVIEQPLCFLVNSWNCIVTFKYILWIKCMYVIWSGETQKPPCSNLMVDKLRQRHLDQFHSFINRHLFLDGASSHCKKKEKGEAVSSKPLGAFVNYHSKKKKRTIFIHSFLYVNMGNWKCWKFKTKLRLRQQYWSLWKWNVHYSGLRLHINAFQLSLSRACCQFYKNVM